MFDDLTYEEIEAIVYEMMEIDGDWYDLYLALSNEQLRRLRVRAKIRKILLKRSEVVVT